jgi:3-oxoacyl-[acyl-carrier protein] reductase
MEELMDTGLRNKVVLITGASGGIGRAAAQAFVDEGARLVLHGNRQIDELKAVVAQACWDDTLCVRFDVADRKAVFAGFETARERFGRIDVCVANAGIWPPESTPFHRMDAKRLQSTLEVNLLGATWTAQAFMAQLAAAGPRPDGHGASLLFTGSTAARFGERDHVDYSIAKAGIYGLVRTLKNEIVRLDPYGRVNLVEPGWTVTHKARPALAQDDVVTHVTQTMGLRQLGRAKDIAQTMVFLSSPLLSRHISGETLTVSGGMEGRLLWNSEEIDPDAIRRRIHEE